MSPSITLTHFLRKWTEIHFKLNTVEKMPPKKQFELIRCIIQYNVLHLKSLQFAQLQHSSCWYSDDLFVHLFTLWGWRLQKINLWNDPQRKGSKGAALCTHPCILVFPFHCCHWSPTLWLSLSPYKHATITSLLFSLCLCCLFCLCPFSVASMGTEVNHAQQDF